MSGVLLVGAEMEAYSNQVANSSAVLGGSQARNLMIANIESVVYLARSDRGRFNF